MSARDSNAMTKLLARGPKVPPEPARPLSIEQLAEYFDVPLDLNTAIARHGRALDGISPMDYEAWAVQYLKDLEANMFGNPDARPVGLMGAFNDRQ